MLLPSNRNVPDGRDAQMERAIFAAQFVFDSALRRQLVTALERRVLEQFRPGEGSNQAEALLETAFDLAQPGIVLVLARGVIFRNPTKQRIGIQQLVYRDRLVG